MIKVGIIGGAGYTAGELIRILINHPLVEFGFIYSESNAGKPVSDVHEGLIGECGLTFASDYDLERVDVVFLCGGHGKSTEFWQQNKLPENLRVIDLAQDFRDESEGYIYGLPELNKSRIEGCRKLANPGCFATAMQLSLLPLAAKGALKGEVNVCGITGSTGAGVKPGATTHFSWRVDNLSVYKPFTHQHLAEINRALEKLQKEKNWHINFIPMRGDFARGIFMTLWLDTDLTDDEITGLYSDFYKDSSFTHFTLGDVDLKQAVNTNKAIINAKKVGNKLLITTAIDNLLKGASGQAVQNMNLMFNLPEDTALKLKASSF